eukprot:5388389-Pyramimonas_sp.AAC.1
MSSSSTPTNARALCMPAADTGIVLPLAVCSPPNPVAGAGVTSPALSGNMSSSSPPINARALCMPAADTGIALPLA